MRTVGARGPGHPMRAANASSSAWTGRVAVALKRLSLVSTPMSVSALVGITMVGFLTSHQARLLFPPIEVVRVRTVALVPASAALLPPPNTIAPQLEAQDQTAAEATEPLSPAALAVAAPVAPLTTGAWAAAQPAAATRACDKGAKRTAVRGAADAGCGKRRRDAPVAKHRPSSQKAARAGGAGA